MVKGLKMVNLSQLNLESPTVGPFVLVMNSRLASTRFGSWATALFVTANPKIGFSRSEQRLLSAALRGLSDDELTCELGISLSAIKKTWRSVYSRIEQSGMAILPPVPEDRVESLDRGKGKKHLVLNYVRSHPEELRPVSMKLLRLHQAGSVKSKHPSPPKLPRHRVGRPRANQ